MTDDRNINTTVAMLNNSRTNNNNNCEEPQQPEESVPQQQQQRLSAAVTTGNMIPTITEPEIESICSNNNNNSNNNWYFLSTPKIQMALLEYQYSGQDLSLIYKYILSPMASFGVNYCTPFTIAPNTITLTGLLFMIASYILMWYHVPLVFDNDDHTLTTPYDDAQPQPALSLPPPRYIFLCNAIAILLYQTLDNMDGKQARRIKASSPLGLYFDHGCDAINSVFGSTNWIIALALSMSSNGSGNSVTNNNNNDSIHSFVMLLGPYALFYCSTWEEYYTGQLIMPIMNGPNEGLIGAVIVSLISFYYGPMYWHQNDWWIFICNCCTGTTTLQVVLPVISTMPTMTFGFVNYYIPDNVRNCDILIFITAICMIQEIVIKVGSIVHRYGIRTVWNLLPLLTLATCTILIGYTPTNNNKHIFQTMPRTCLHLSSILFVDMTTDLMLKHMTKQQYQPIRFIMVPLVLLTIFICTDTWPHTSQITIEELILIYTSISGTYLIIKSMILIHEMCIVLNIWCFTIGQRRIRSDEHTSRIAHSGGVKID